MASIKKYVKKTLLLPISWQVRRKTKLTQQQSYELTETLVRTLYGMHGLRFWKNSFYLKVMFHCIDWKRFAFREETFRKYLDEKQQMPGYREPIGVWYTIASEYDYEDAPRVQNTDGLTYYGSGREPLLAVAEQIAPERKVVLLPYYTCATVYQPFLENGWKTVYYRVSRDLRINTREVEALFEEHKPSIAVFMEYSGMDLTQEELQTVAKLKQAGCVTMVDRAQNFYSQRCSDAVDFYFGSVRKWYPCPDGGYLQRNSLLPMPPVPEEGIYNDVYATTCAAMMYCRSQAQKTKLKQYLYLSFFFRKISTSYVCCQPVRCRNMTEYSKAVYFKERENDALYMQRRQENFKYLFERISAMTSVKPVCSDVSRFSSAPFYLHIYADDRERLRQFLQSYGIVTWVYWNKPKNLGQLDEDSEYIYNHVLSLPCDQRYTLREMKYLCDTLQGYEKTYAKSN